VWRRWWKVDATNVIRNPMLMPLRFSAPRVAHSLAILSFLVALPLVVQSQSPQPTTGTLEGTVRTQAGVRLEGATLRFQPARGGAAQTTVTDAQGSFRLTLPAGEDGALEIAAPGMVTETRIISPLAAGDVRALALTLVPLYQLDAITVVRGRDRPLLNTEDAAQGGALEGAEIQALPTDARNPLTLAFTVPGVSQATAFFGDAPPLTISGDNALYTAYTIDGLDNKEGFLGGPRVQLPLAALARLEVFTATYRPGLGRSPNGVVSMETRAGGPTWEGELLLAGRPGTPLDASPKFTPAGVDPDGFRRFQFGGALGGPLVQDRTFLFVAVEGTDEREDRIGSTAQTDFLGTELRTTWRGFARLDHGWSPTQTTTLRLALSDVARVGQGGGVIVPEADITTVRRGTLSSLTHRSTLRGGEAANTFSLQWGTFRWDFPPSASDLSTPQVTIVSPDLTTVEAVVGSSNFIFDERERQIQLRNVFEAQRGAAHTFRLGADVMHSRFELLGANTNPMGAYTVVNEGNIRPSGPFVSIRDVPADVRVIRFSLDARAQQVNLGQTLVGAFFEHAWRPRANLTLLSGLRWDYDDITSRGESTADLDNIQPRLSLNWLPTPRGALRAGWGIYTGTFPYAIYSDAVQFGPDGNRVVTFEGADFPPPALGQGPAAAAIATLEGRLPPGEERRMFARGLEQPFSRQTTLGWGMELGADWALSVDGLWMESRNLPRSWDLNALDRPITAADTLNLPPEAGDPFRPMDPSATGFRRLTTTDAGGRGQHLALHTVVRRAPARGVGLEGSWVWSRTRNDTEDINFHATQGNRFEDEWADAINDRRHHLTLRAHWRPEARGWRSRLFVGGVADYQTGSPVNRIAFFRDLDGSGPIFGNGFLGNHDRFAGVPRNGERLPGAFRVDGSLGYGIPLPTGTLETRLEVFNLLNSTLKTGFANGIPGGGPRTQVGRPGDAMVFSTAAPPRQFQLTARWAF
jgi:hypothetical protein